MTIRDKVTVGRTMGARIYKDHAAMVFSLGRITFGIPREKYWQGFMVGEMTSVPMRTSHGAWSRLSNDRQEMILRYQSNAKT